MSSSKSGRVRADGVGWGEEYGACTAHGMRQCVHCQLLHAYEGVSAPTLPHPPLPRMCVICQSLALRCEMQPASDHESASLEAKQRVLEARAASALVEDGPAMDVVRRCFTHSCKLSCNNAHANTHSIHIHTYTHTRAHTHTHTHTHAYSHRHPHPSYARLEDDFLKRLVTCWRPTPCFASFPSLPPVSCLARLCPFPPWLASTRCHPPQWAPRAPSHQGAVVRGPVDASLVPCACASQ